MDILLPERTQTQTQTQTQIQTQTQTETQFVVWRSVARPVLLQTQTQTQTQTGKCHYVCIKQTAFKLGHGPKMGRKTWAEKQEPTRGKFELREKTIRFISALLING